MATTTLFSSVFERKERFGGLGVLFCLVGLFSFHEHIIYLERSLNEAWHCACDFWLRKRHKERVNGVVISRKNTFICLLHVYTPGCCSLFLQVRYILGFTWCDLFCSLLIKLRCFKLHAFLLLMLKRAKFR